MLDARQKTKNDLALCEVQIRTNFTALTHHILTPKFILPITYTVSSLIKKQQENIDIEAYNKNYSVCV